MDYHLTVQGKTYEAFVYGQRNLQPSRVGVPVWGVALDDKFAVAESPLRILEAAEAKDAIAAGKARKDVVCGISAKPADSSSEPTYAALAEKMLGFCNPVHAVSYGKLLGKKPSPRHVEASGGGVSGAGVPDDFIGPVAGNHGGGAYVSGATYTQGTKTILYMRLAFPDDPTEPITEQQAYKDLDDLNQFFVGASYNTFNIVGVVTPLLMMPHPKKWYALPAPVAPALVNAGVGAFLYAHARRGGRGGVLL